MKLIILVILAIMLTASPAFASPYLVCDPQTGVTHYKLTGPAWVTSPVTAQVDGSLRTDVATSTVGLNSLTVAACKNDAVWGEQCSTFVPFVFTRPSAPTIPANIKLQP